MARAKRITSSEMEQVATLYRTGVPVAEIARQVHRNPSTCLKIVKEAGIPFRSTVKAETKATDLREGFRTCKDCGERKPLQQMTFDSNCGPMTLCRDCASRRAGHVPFSRQIPALTESQLAYLAALIDGEGCLSIVKIGKAGAGYSCKITVVNTAPQLPEIWREYGVGRLYLKTNRPAGHKPCYHWIMSANVCRALLPLLLPHLRIKQAQAQLLLKFLPLVDSRRRLCRRGVTPEDRAMSLAQARALYFECKRLNKRGA